MKNCTKCKLPKNPSEFYKNNCTRDSLSCWCKVCTKIGMQKYHQSEQGRAIHNKYAQSDKGKAIAKRVSERFRQSEYGKEWMKTYMRTYRTTLRRYLYDRWVDIYARCNNPKHKLYKYYGAKDVKCLFKSFSEFFEYVTITLGFTSVDVLKGLQIHRIGNNHYEKGNIEFLTSAEHGLRHRNLNRQTHEC